MTLSESAAFEAPALRVLITNVTLASRTGTETYVRDLALGLSRAGHRPCVYSPRLGPIGSELAAAGVPVSSDLDSFSEAPDIIHGHHNAPTLAALLRFPQAPGIFVCHDRTSGYDVPPTFPRIARYVAVDWNCRERLLEASIAEERISVIYNWVDLDRFRPRGPLPARPRKALVFSNYMSDGPVLSALRTACKRRAIELHTLGSGVDKLTVAPEQVLPEYDIVFAKARSAIEAMAVGNAVVLFGPTGLGPMVAAADLEQLRPWNFGMRTITEPVSLEGVERELDRYDAADAARVSSWIRTGAGFDDGLGRWLRLYREVLADPPIGSPAEEALALSRFLGSFSAFVWSLIDPPRPSPSA
jgi:glycosyltransferase involved in cell wall biosynthesis